MIIHVVLKYSFISFFLASEITNMSLFQLFKCEEFLLFYKTLNSEGDSVIFKYYC